MSNINYTARMLALAERIIADYKDANEAWKADGANHSTNTELLDWYECATGAFWDIADWVTMNGTTEQASFIADEAKDFDKVWTEEYNRYRKKVVGYWKTI